MATAQKAWNGAATKWLVGGFLLMITVLVGILIESSRGIRADVKAHAQKPGHPIQQERMRHTEEELKEVRDSIGSINTAIHAIERTQDRHGLILERIEEKLNSKP